MPSERKLKRKIKANDEYQKAFKKIKQSGKLKRMPTRSKWNKLTRRTKNMMMNYGFIPDEG